MISESIKKQQLIDWIDQLSDPGMLKTLHALRESSESGKDFWHELPPVVQKVIDDAKEEVRAGYGISHTNVIDKAKKRWLQH